MPKVSKITITLLDNTSIIIDQINEVDPLRMKFPFQPSQQSVEDIEMSAEELIYDVEELKIQKVEHVSSNSNPSSLE